MKRACLSGAAICLAGMALLSAAQTGGRGVTWTGWFSDLKCASARAANGTFTSTNPECAKTCIKEGAAPAFISEQAKAVFTLKDSPSVIDQLGYHVEVQATVDDAARTITIRKIKQLGYDGAACQRRKH
ncbi:MAG: hypothetical protein ABSC93_09950 [Bryobacteraceae bacterium]